MTLLQPLGTIITHALFADEALSNPLVGLFEDAPPPGGLLKRKVLWDIYDSNTKRMFISFSD